MNQQNESPLCEERQESLKLSKEAYTMTLTIIHKDGDTLTFDEAKAFADALLAERGEQRAWTHNGSSRQNYNRVKLFYVR